MSFDNKNKQTPPKEIPTHRHPDNQKPLKDPLSPNEDNPINPMTDDTQGDNQ